jgi:hypothetical protein
MYLAEFSKSGVKSTALHWGHLVVLFMLLLHISWQFGLCRYRFSTTLVANRPLEHNTKHKKHKTHNNQHEPPSPYPPVALPSFTMATSAMDPNLGASDPYGPIQGARHRVRSRCCLFLRLGCQNATHRKLERGM